MNILLLTSASLAFSFSVLLIIYSGHAQAEGLPQGSLFASGKAMMLGYLGLICTIGIHIAKQEWAGLFASAAIAYFIFTPITLSWLQSRVQLLSIIGLPISIVAMLISK
jgi:hypothetical protein